MATVAAPLKVVFAPRRVLGLFHASVMGVPTHSLSMASKSMLATELSASHMILAKSTTAVASIQQYVY